MTLLSITSDAIVEVVDELDVEVVGRMVVVVVLDVVVDVEVAGDVVDTIVVAMVADDDGAVELSEEHATKVARHAPQTTVRTRSNAISLSSA